MLRVLFVCVHNSARSQMAEELLRLVSAGRMEACSAGLEPGPLNPFVVRALGTLGIDISGKQPRDVFELYKSGARFHYVITVCDEASAERCPIFPGALKYLHWSFPDPSGFAGSDNQVLDRTLHLMEQIEAKIVSWLENFNA